MHNEHTRDQMIASFLSRKAEQFPEIFDDTATRPAVSVRPSLRFFKTANN